TQLQNGIPQELRVAQVDVVERSGDGRGIHGQGPQVHSDRGQPRAGHEGYGAKDRRHQVHEVVIVQIQGKARRDVRALEDEGHGVRASAGLDARATNSNPARTRSRARSRWIPVEEAELMKALKSGFNYLHSKLESERLHSALDIRTRELSSLNEIGISLSSEQDYDTLLGLILSKSREITNCDAGSLYLLDRTKETGNSLIFKLVQNDSLTNLEFKEYALPLARSSLAGYVALTGEFINLEDVYDIPDDVDYSFNKAFDNKFKYRTKSMLVIPMKDHKNKTIGVLQLINRKKSKNVKLTSDSAVEDEVGPFDESTFGLINSLASQAAVSIENSLLYQNIQNLFEGFVKASVLTIEQRDPTTCGHSERVSSLTVGLAEVVDRVSSGKYRDIHFSHDNLKEIRYAGLLHDFGKIGVRENVLVKANKLYPDEIKYVRSRFDFIKKSMECKYLEKKLSIVRDNKVDDYQKYFKEIDNELKEELIKLDVYIEGIEKANIPTILEDGLFDELKNISDKVYQDYSGIECNYLTPYEFNLLSIKKGTLDEKERHEIESHVAHSYEFLKKIPWTKEFENIPDIAHAHHEKLNGGGYPLGINEDEIPIQSKMMAITDIYDALTAQDRPYKKAVPHNKALDIIGYDVKGNLLDSDLFDMFVKEKVYEIVHEDR
ncbi:MAG: GAF domain-containing protein, partial [Candidatus Brocadiales bacterium]|nr:GAF domain-containing protein [Candidatus Brocadiales bacterium]